MARATQEAEPVTALSEAQRAELEAWESRALTAEEFEARVQTPMSDREREDFIELVAWFNRRYPTAGERLAAIRRQTANWTRNRFR